MVSQLTTQLLIASKSVVQPLEERMKRLLLLCLTMIASGCAMISDAYKIPFVIHDGLVRYLARVSLTFGYQGCSRVSK